MFQAPPPNFQDEPPKECEPEIERTTELESPSSMPTIVQSAVCQAMDTRIFQIESAFTRGFSGFHLIGNATEICRDGKERAKAALEYIGIHIPPRKLVVSLTPADIKKDGNQFDLPIAMTLALLLKVEARAIDPSRWLFAAELGLSGEIRPVKGVVSFAVAAIAAGLSGIVVAKENLPDIIMLAKISGEHMKGIKLLGFSNIADVVHWVYTGLEPDAANEPCALRQDPSHHATPSDAPDSTNFPDYDDMILVPDLKKAALTIAAGLHSVLLRGSPGTGKSMFSARLPSILPKMNEDVHIEAMKIHSAFSERLPTGILMGRAPFRAPHHQASSVAVLGNPSCPGELSLAHGGILFLDEIPEFRRDLIESLREPLETGEVRVSRANKKIVWKAKVILAAACNNCPCGWSGSHRKQCRCSTQRLHAYQQKLSGPILERIDIHINMPESKEKKSEIFLALARGQTKEQTEGMAAHVIETRRFASERNKTFGVMFNRDLQASHLIEASGLSKDGFSTLVNTFIPRTASSRAAIRALRVARTLADLDFSPRIRDEDLRQAWGWQAEMAAKERGDHAQGF